jgi:hypothetical protein
MEVDESRWFVQQNGCQAAGVTVIPLSPQHSLEFGENHGEA